MDSSNGKGNDFERRSSLRRSLRISSTANGAPDDDDYDLSAMMVADGFRPTDHTTSAVVPPLTSQPPPEPEQDTPSTPIAQAQQLPPIGTPLQQLGPAANITPIQKADMRTRPSSISKPPRNHDSLALRNEGTSTSASGRTHVARISSISSESPVMRAESPYRGPSGPSHPYQMYPQRTMSVATTSTTAAAAAAIIPDDRSYTGPSGPTHPYALYPQNTVPAAEPAGDPIPLGFGGMGGNYQRQLGPDGEEAGDMIGPLGHMEELPPYTRYADNAFAPKDATIPEASTETTPTTEARDATPSTEPTSPDRIIAGAGGIGIATRDPEFSSTEDDIGMPRTRPSVRSVVSETSQHDVNTAARDVAEKTPENKWQKRARKKLWGIVPYWAICLLTVGLIIMGIIMGAVIGTLLTRHKKPPKDHDASVTTTTTVEVQPFTAIPTDLKPMATGHYGLPPFKVSQEPKSCFSDPSLAEAWSCDMPFSYYSMDVTVNSDGLETEGYQLAMNAINAIDAEFIWGTRPPSFSDPITLALVNDTFEIGRGPAWWSMITYNKTVIVSESDFQYVSKRGWHEDDEEEEDDDDDEHFPPPPGFKSRKGAGAKPGDKPWICTWPDVTLEVFIYPKQKSSAHFGSTTTTSGYGASSTTDLYGSSATYGSSTTIYGASTTTSSSSATSTSKSGFENAPPSYPKVLKMVEQRHWAKKSAASCRQVEIDEDGKSCRPVRDKDGNPLEVAIVETESTTSSSKLHPRQRYIPKRWYVLDLLRRGAFELTPCGCLWWAT